MKKLMLILIASGLFLFLPVSKVTADEFSDLKQQILELKQQSELQQKKIDELTEKFGALEETQQIQAQEVKEVKEAAQDPGGALGGLTAKITGTGEINFKHVDIGKKDADSSFAVEKIMLYVTGQVSEDIDYFSEFMINPRTGDDEVHAAHDETIQVERLYLTSSKIIPGHTLKVGLFQLFDGPIKDYHVGTNNPLPGDIIFFKNPWTHENTLHDIFTDVGISIGGMKPPFGYTFAVVNGMGDRTLSGTDIDNAYLRGFFTKLFFVPPMIPGLSLSSMYYTGEKTASAEWGNEKDEYVISEVVYRWNDLELIGMYLSGTQRRQSGNSEFDNKGSGFMFQTKYNLTNKLSLIGRYQEIIVSDRDDMEFFGVGKHENTGDVSQLELGINYRIRPRVWLKASYQKNDESGEDNADDRILGSVAFAF